MTNTYKDQFKLKDVEIRAPNVSIFLKSYFDVYIGTAYGAIDLYILYFVIK